MPSKLNEGEKMAENIILLTDSYKPSHWTQYPPKTQKIYSYLEARGGEFDETCFFGLYPILKNYLSRPISLNDFEVASHFGEHPRTDGDVPTAQVAAL